jgi:pilus assembly protein CpaE
MIGTEHPVHGNGREPRKALEVPPLETAPGPAALSVVIVHHDEIERQQLRAAFEGCPGIQIAGERSDLRAGLALARQGDPAILMLEIAPSIDDVLAATAAYRLERPEVAVFLVGEPLESDDLLRAMRAGAQEVLRRPFDRATLERAVERVSAVRSSKEGRATRHALITVYSAKGGSGVSMIAANLAVSLRVHDGRDVALADFDDQAGDAAFLLGVKPQRTMADLLSAARLDSASVQDALARHESGLYVLPQPERLERTGDVRPREAGAVLEMLSSIFDVVVVDAPHTLGDVALEILDRSSTVLLLVEQSVTSVRAARRALEVFRARDYVTIPHRVRVIVNRYSPKSPVSREQIAETLELPIFATIANDYPSVIRSINEGRPLCDPASHSAAGRDLAALSRRLMAADRVSPVTAGTKPASDRHGLARLFGRSGVK